MPCYHPQAAWRDPNTGSVVFVGAGRLSNLTLPCGQCIGCLLERSRQWAVRCYHESKLHPYNSFLTLTYDESNLPDHGSLSLRDHQLFMKRLRKRHDVRFYMCGEYGPLNKRPHYHYCIFGYHFPDRSPFGRGYDISHELRSLWPYGNSSVGDLTFDSACYTSGYITQKLNGAMAEKEYSVIDPETGEILEKTRPFNQMSRRGGIGKGFFDLYHNEMYPNDYVVIKGKKAKPPRFYDKHFEKLDADQMELVRLQREMDAQLRHMDNTPARLNVREQVVSANLSSRSKLS